jgi:hypothetical protein
MVKAFRTGRNKDEIKSIYRELADRWVKRFKPGEVPSVNDKDVEDTFNHVLQIMEKTNVKRK